jgi:uncharacterized protein GlcG (DUF336 family)
MTGSKVLWHTTMSVDGLVAERTDSGCAAGVARRSLKPVAICVLDPGGHVIVVKRQDGASFLRSDIAKAWTALSLGVPSRAVAAMAESGPVFVSSMVTISEGRMAPAAAGLTVVRDGTVVGTVGVSGETPGNDEALAVEGIGAAGLAWGESAS